MKKNLKKFKLGIINYRSHKIFSSEAFRECFLEKLSKTKFSNNDDGLQRFSDRNLLKYAWGDQMPFMTKQLSKEIMKRSRRLRNNFLRNTMKDNWIFYKRQINYFLSLSWKSKKEYYKNLNVKKITDKKVFWKTIKPQINYAWETESA